MLGGGGGQGDGRGGGTNEMRFLSPTGVESRSELMVRDCVIVVMDTCLLS